MQKEARAPYPLLTFHPALAHPRKSLIKFDKFYSNEKIIRGKFYFYLAQLSQVWISRRYGAHTKYDLCSKDVICSTGLTCTSHYHVNNNNNTYNKKEKKVASVQLEKKDHFITVLNQNAVVKFYLIG